MTDSKAGAHRRSPQPRSATPTARFLFRRSTLVVAAVLLAGAVAVALLCRTPGTPAQRQESGVQAFTATVTDHARGSVRGAAGLAQSQIPSISGIRVQRGVKHPNLFLLTSDSGSEITCVQFPAGGEGRPVTATYTAAMRTSTPVPSTADDC